MKRTILFIISTTLTFQLYAQKESDKINVPFDSTTQKYTYTRIVEASNKNAPTLYRIAKEWCKQKYSDDKFQIDEESNHLVDLGNFSINVVMHGRMGIDIPFSFSVLYNIKFYFKDGKCKFEVSDIKLSKNAQGTTEEETLEGFEKQQESIDQKKAKNIYREFVLDTFNQIDVNMLKLIAEIEKTLKGDSKSKSDW